VDAPETSVKRMSKYDYKVLLGLHRSP